MDQIPYKPASATDVLATFRRFGWTPPSELPEYQAKWKAFREQSNLIPTGAPNVH